MIPQISNRALTSLLVISTIFILTLSIARAPVPFCKSQKLYHQFPMILDETLTNDMSNSFSGYNLNIKLTSKNNFATINQKLTLLDKKKISLPNIISHYIEQKGNKWGSETFVLYQKGNTTEITYGHFKHETSLPVYDAQVEVETDSNVTCYDAVLFYSYGVAIVDCVHRDDSSVFSQLTNWFYYVDMTAHTVLKKVRNAMFVPFAEITKRKTMAYRNPETGQEYFLRTYLADGVDKGNQMNTYMEIFIATDPHDIQLHSVLDRSYLHQNTLSISDATIYLDDIFFLDERLGVYRLDILKNQQVAILGRYDKIGFKKFAIYSDDLQNEVWLALANNHAIYEVSWHNNRNPTLVNKYSLMENSTVSELIVNNRYIICQSKSIAQDQDNKQYQIDYTWVFTKGSRTYSHAHIVVDHKSQRTAIDFSREDDRLILADQQGVSLWQLDEARLFLHQHNASKIGKSQKVVISAESTDPHHKSNKTCQEQFQVFFVENDTLEIWPTGYEQPSNFSFNYPGEVHLPLDNYAIGPLLNFDIKNPKSDEVPQHWVNKLNQTNLKIDKPTQPGDIKFFYTEVIVKPQTKDEMIYYYYEESNNVTHVAECTYIWESITIDCHLEATYAHNSAIMHFSTAFFTNEQGSKHFYVISLQGDQKMLYIIDYAKHKRIAEIRYSGDLQGIIGGISSSNGYLYVLLPYIKTINVYKLSICLQEQQCQIQFKIDPETLKPLGVDYFAPQQLVTDKEHPEVIFIKCLGELLILDVDNRERITVLNEIVSPAMGDKFYKIAVNKDRMVVVAYPNIIEEYDLRLVYKKQVKLVKNIPAYGFTFPPVGDIEFSDFNHLIYIHAYDPAHNKSVILVYRCGYPAVSALTQEILLDKHYSRPGLQIQVSGFLMDFVSIIAQNNFMVYRMFEEPYLAIKDAKHDFRFDLEISNPTSGVWNSSDFTVSIVNNPTGFIPTKEFNQTMNNIKVSAVGNYSWEDRKWFQGHVLSFNYFCEECPKKDNKTFTEENKIQQGFVNRKNLKKNSQMNKEEEAPKVRIREHVDAYRPLDIGGIDYIQTFLGGVSVYQDLFRWHINGSVAAVYNLPDQKLLQYCNKVTATYFDLFIVTSCQEIGRGINLYITSTVSHKGFTWGPYPSPAYNARKLQICEDILLLVDTSSYPEQKHQEGDIYLYQLSLDPVTEQEMVELEIINSDDFMGAHGWNQQKAYLGNAHLIYSSNTQAFRLYVSEVDNGFYVIDFTKKGMNREINILATEFVDMNALLLKNGFHLPNDASYQAISRTSEKYNPHFDTENVVITTKGYHNFEVTLVWDDTGHLVSTILYRVYYRYAYYNTYNEIKTINGYLAVGYVIPPLRQFQTIDNKQIVAVYDTRDYEGESEKGYSQRYMLGSYLLKHSYPVMFAFNTTYDLDTNGTRWGLVVSEPFYNVDNKIFHASVSRDLQVMLEKGFKDQSLTLTPFNDFANYTFTVDLRNPDEDTSEEILIITILILCILVTLFFTGYVIVLVRRKKRNEEQGQKRESLLTEEKSQLNRESVEQRRGMKRQDNNDGDQRIRQRNERDASGEDEKSDQGKDAEEIINKELNEEDVEKMNGEVEGEPKEEVREEPKEEVREQPRAEVSDQPKEELREFAQQEKESEGNLKEAPEKAQQT